MGNDSWQLEVARPLWLVALTVLPLLGLGCWGGLTRLPRWRQSGLLAIRVLLVLLLVAALCGLDINIISHEPFVAVAVDRSASIAAEARRAEEAFLAELAERLPREQWAVLPFGRQPGQRGPGRGLSGLPDPNGTNIAAALAAARAEIPARFVPQVILLSDGNQTAGDAIAVARLTNVPVSVVSLPGAPEDEVYISAIRSPEQVRQGDSFTIEVVLQATGENEGDVHLSDGATIVAQQRVKLAAGENRVQFQHTILGRDRAIITAVVVGFRDTIAENNRASAIVLATPIPRVLLVDSRTDARQPLAEALRGLPAEVEVRPPAAMPRRADDLKGYDLVVLSNIPATGLGQAQMEAVRTYVQTLAGGLIAIGGDQAFAAGGYRRTALEDVLPVVSEFNKERAQPGLALVLVLDRSGSMEGGSIALAKKAAQRAVELLSPRDQVGIIAFEDGSRWVSELGPCVDKKAVLDRLDTIVAGGGTNMHPALEKARRALEESFADLKHIIVLTDGVSSSADFELQSRRIAESGITISTVGVGTQVAQPLLQEIAKRGGGHYYYCENASAVPQVFAMETTSAARPGIVEEPFTAQPAGPMAFLAGVNFERSPTLLGYGQTQAKPGATVALRTKQHDPLLAWWQTGAGTSVAFTADVQSRWAAAWLRWDGFNPFWKEAARLAMRPAPPSRIAEHAGVYPEELRVRPTNVRLLQEICRLTGGEFGVRAGRAISRPERTIPGHTPLWPILLATAALLFVFDVGMRRVALPLPAA